MRISLCVICGNEIDHIISMLDSFRECFDQLSLVRAIGKQEPDATLGLAQDWCRDNGKDFVFSEHRNDFNSQTWDHIDSFAAARNESFAQADGEWLIWADCDDQIEGAGLLRESLQNAPDDVLMARYPYDVRGTGKKLLRERAVRRSAFNSGRKWHHEVHENLLLLPNDNHVDLLKPVWLHCPVEIKRQNRKRNLRILANSVRECASQYFYIHQEHYCNGSREAAEQFGKLALQFPNLAAPFRYETLLNLARICGNHREATSYTLEAHGIFPWCREAIAAIIMLHFEKNDSQRAKFWAERMMELPEPPEHNRPWTHEAKYYGWAGDDLSARAHRLAGDIVKANQIQLRYYSQKTPRISLLHATRGRSTKAVACRDMWLNAAENPSQIEHIFAVDADDKDSLGMSHQFISVVSEKQTCVSAWNLAASKASGDLIIQLSDDWVPPLHWDSKLLALVKDRDLAKEQIVIAVSDGHRKDDLLCMAILSRARLEAQGDLFFDGYESVFSDNEFSHRAFADRVVIDARASIRFDHLHPAFGKAKMDKTYEHNNSTERYKRGEQLFNERNKQ